MSAAREWRSAGHAQPGEVRVQDEPAEERPVDVAERPKRGRSRSRSTPTKRAGPASASALEGNRKAEPEARPEIEIGAAAVTVPTADPVPAEPDPVISDGVAADRPHPAPVYPEPRLGGLPTKPFRDRLWQIQTGLREVHRARSSRRQMRGLQRLIKPLRGGSRGRSFLAGAIAVAVALVIIVLLIAG